MINEEHFFSKYGIESNLKNPNWEVTILMPIIGTLTQIDASLFQVLGTRTGLFTLQRLGLEYVVTKYRTVSCVKVCLCI